ncbi:MAG: hypothetical protein GEV03_22930 [Streptosporangiales bacterium]|nr:hypothetical protein [Streptosporangiales bacterium]
MSTELLPAGAYLAWRYVDPHFAIGRAQVYYDDGRVEAIEGDRTWELCRFTPEQVVAAKAAVVDSGLPTSVDAFADGAYDTAPITYAWRLGDAEGGVTNAGYPAVHHEAMEKLEAALAELEEAAGGWPLLADE